MGDSPSERTERNSAGRTRVLAGLAAVAACVLASQAGASIADGVGLGVQVGLGPLGTVGVSVGVGMGGGANQPPPSQTDAFLAAEQSVQSLSNSLVRLLESGNASPKTIEDLTNSIETLTRTKALMLIQAGK